MTFDTIKEYQRRWAEIGFVPIKKKEAIQAEFRQVVDGLFEQLRGEERERHMRNFREKVSKIQEGGAKRLGQERDRILAKIRQIEADIQIWENNIGFFARSKNAEGLMKEVRNKIERAKEQIATMVEQVRMIDRPAQNQKSRPSTSTNQTLAPESTPVAEAETTEEKGAEQE